MNEEVYNQIAAMVQAAMSGDQQAGQQIAQIMQAAELGDAQAKQLAAVIQDVASKIQQAKFGAKLNYIGSLNGKCPEGYEVEKFMAGGCVKCAKKKVVKASGGTRTDTPQRFNSNDNKNVRVVKETFHEDENENIIHTRVGSDGTTSRIKFDPDGAGMHVTGRDGKTYFKANGSPISDKLSIKADSVLDADWSTSAKKQVWKSMQTPQKPSKPKVKAKVSKKYSGGSMWPLLFVDDSTQLPEVTVYGNRLPEVTVAYPVYKYGYPSVKFFNDGHYTDLLRSRRQQKAYDMLLDHLNKDINGNTIED